MRESLVNSSPISLGLPVTLSKFPSGMPAFRAYGLHYLNVMAGTRRGWHVRNEPAHERLLQSVVSVAADGVR
ncbi:KduI/IolB family protein [Paraburkholderia sp. BL18I3N2]|nr:KduI/IolB family protein [Paraburkholderia sp. BL18I3N2]